MITIKMREGKWLLEITGEVWQFDLRTDLENELKKILESKEYFGRIK